MDILTLTQQDNMVQDIRSAVTANRPEIHIEHCHDLVDLKAKLIKHNQGRPVDLALVDLDPDPEPLFKELGKVVTTHPKTQFVVMSQAFNENLVLRAMHAGARHFLRKSHLASEIDDMLEHLLLRDRPNGYVITVLSCSGGCGATTTAVNVASELSLQSGKRSLVLDFDMTYGAVAHQLGLEGSYGIGHVLTRPGIIDRHLIESAAIKGKDGIDILLSPASAVEDRKRPFEASHLVTTLQVCKESYPYVMVDAPRVPEGMLSDLMAASDAVVIVFQLMVKDVQFAQSFMSRLTDMGFNSDRLLLVANRVRKQRYLLDLKDVQKALQASHVHCLRNDWSSAMKSMDKKMTLAHTAKRSRLRRDLNKLACRIEELMGKSAA